jgi:transposase
MVELGMRQPIFVHTLCPAERAALVEALRTKEAFRLLRAQVLLASANGLKAAQIAATYGCSDQTVRNIIRDFEARGPAALTPQSKARKDQQAILDLPKLEALRALLHRSPRDFDKPTSLWSLALVATVAFEQGLTPYVVSIETIRNALKRLNVGWKRAKHWITSPDPAYEAKKNGCSA